MYKNKFRIWSKTSNQYINLQTSGYYVALDDDNGELKIFSLDIGDYYGNVFSEIDQNNFVIEQFTGIQDKNGKDIYEGDIVTWGYAKCAVEFGELNITSEDCIERYMYGWKTGKSNIDCADDSIDNKCEIIGNIHQNKELIND